MGKNDSTYYMFGLQHDPVLWAVVGKKNRFMAASVKRESELFQLFPTIDVIFRMK